MARNPNSTRHKWVEYDWVRKQVHSDFKIQGNQTGYAICIKCKIVRESWPGEPRVYYYPNDKSDRFGKRIAPKCITNLEYDKLLQIVDASDRKED